MFSFPEDFRFKVVIPFLNGKYSQIDREYVEKFFSKKVIDEHTGKPVDAPNYRILTKDPSVLDY